jgi:hypothetical protein
MGAALLVGAAMAPYGPGMTPDSVHYLSAAENLRRGLGYATSVVPWNGPFPRPIALWPPLYPAVLAVVTAAIGATAGPWGLNALLMGVSTWRIARAAPLLGALAFAIAPAVISVHGYAWSEPLFLLLAILALEGQERLLAEPAPKRLAFAVLFTALACLTRYVGVALVISGALALVLAGRRLLALIYAALAVAPLGLWLLRNRLVTGTLMGDRTGSGRGLPELIREAAGTLGGWLVPVGSLATVALLVLLAVGVVLALRSDFEPRDLPWIAFGAVYPVLLLALARTVAFDPLSSRLLVPLVVPLVVLAARHLDWHRRGLATAVALLLVASPALVTARDLASTVRVTRGRGYRAARWRETEAVRMAALHQGPFAASAGDGLLYSDAPDVLWLYSGRPVRYLPEEGTDPAVLRGGSIVLVGLNPTLPDRLDPTGSPLFRVERTLGRGAVLLPAGGAR